MPIQEIKSLISLFRQHGGIFENAELKHSQEAGIYCHTLDSSKKSSISCPASLLINTKDIGINNKGLFITQPQKYGDRVKFLNSYLAAHFNASMLEQHSRNKKHIELLSNNNLALIAKVAPSYLYDLKQYSNLSYEKNRMLGCHKINFDGRVMLMPFTTLLNHNKNGQPFVISKESISVSGTFEGEICAEYQMGDALMMGTDYEFISDAKYAYSLPFWFDSPDGTRIIIDRKTMTSEFSPNGQRIPTLNKNAKSITLSWFPLFIETKPRFPAIVAEMLSAHTNLHAEMLLLHIFKHNLNVLIPAAFQLKQDKNQYARYIADVCQKQLEVLSGS